MAHNNTGLCEVAVVAASDWFPNLAGTGDPYLWAFEV